MKPLAWVLIVAIPWTAFVTVFVALRRGRPRPYQGWDSGRVERRLHELDAAAPLSGEAERERRELWQELFRRGRAYGGPPSGGNQTG